MATRHQQHHPTKYVTEPTPLLCPICKRVFSEPIISVKCGHTFCKACIEELIRGGQGCPLDDQSCDSGHLVLNRAIMGQLADLQIYCRHGLRPVGVDSGHGGGRGPGDDLLYERDPDGCPEVIRVGEREKHEKVCQFALVQCPVGQALCGSVRKAQLEAHIEACPNIPCPFTDFGCEFVGGRLDVATHKANCSYRDEAQLIAITMKELKSLKVSNEELQKSLTSANKAIEKLTLERVTMTTRMEQQAMTITSLTSRMDKLEMELESFKAVRLRATSSSRRGNDATPRYHHRERNNNHNDHKRWSTESTASSTCLEPHLGPFNWQMPFTVKCIGTFRGHKGTIWSVVTSGSHLYSGSSDGSIKMWDILDLRRGCLRTVSAHQDCVLCLAVGCGMLFSTGTDHYIRSWHLESLEEIGSVQIAQDGMSSAMTCGKNFLFTSYFGCIKIWDAVSLKEVHKIESISQSWVRALAYDKKKDMLYSSSSNKIHMWKCSEDFPLINAFETQYGALYSLATTRKYIITGTHSQNVQVYDKLTLSHLHTLSGHIGRVTSLRVVESHQGEYMFSGSSDATVTVWNLENMLPILTLQRHEKAVHSLAVWQDFVFTGSEDMEIKVFRHFKL